jgi:hypothetical protein
MSTETVIPAIQDASLAVAAVRARLLDGLTSVEVFAEAVDRTPRQVSTWIAQGMPVTYIGRTPYVQIDAARDWLRSRRQRVMEPRGPGRPRKAA